MARVLAAAACALALGLGLLPGAAAQFRCRGAVVPSPSGCSP
eukprot:SAG22_NODE_18346_length_288_cov_2.179894_2_plen_41_part_01